MKLYFGEEALVIPGAALGADADVNQLRVLLWLASDPSLADAPQKLSKLVECDLRTVRAALSFWQEQGILRPEGGATPVHEARSPRVTASRATKVAEAIPVYSSGEIADLLEARSGMSALVNEAQNILGKIFTPADLNVLVGMVDYLSMDEACILLLLAHCKRIGKTSLRSIERYAISLSDKGILEAAGLDEYIREVEALHTLEGEVRKMFGLKSRALSEKEKKILKTWLDYGYGEEVIRRAFERNVDAKGEASLPYTHAILERWHAEGLSTLEEIDLAMAREDEKKRGEAMGSFSTDDYFEAALQRSFRENEER